MPLFTAKIIRNSPSDTYPLLEESTIQGGYRTVADLTERDAIFPAVRKIGMRVRVVSEDKEYILKLGITNGDWVEDLSGGADGDSAYEVALAQGFVGTESAWLASLVGAQGPAGPDGNDGAPGVDGADNATLQSVTDNGGESVKSGYGEVTFKPDVHIKNNGAIEPILLVQNDTPGEVGSLSFKIVKGNGYGDTGKRAGVIQGGEYIILETYGNKGLRFMGGFSGGTRGVFWQYSKTGADNDPRVGNILVTKFLAANAAESWPIPEAQMHIIGTMIVTGLATMAQINATALSIEQAGEYAMVQNASFLGDKTGQTVTASRNIVQKDFDKGLINVFNNSVTLTLNLFQSETGRTCAINAWGTGAITLDASAHDLVDKRGVAITAKSAIRIYAAVLIYDATTAIYKLIGDYTL